MYVNKNVEHFFIYSKYTQVFEVNVYMEYLIYLIMYDFFYKKSNRTNELLL